MLTNDEIHALAPFTYFVGVTYAEISKQRVVATLEATHERSTVGGSPHGGAQ